MREAPNRITIELSRSELELIERAAHEVGEATADFVRGAATQAARRLDRSASKHAATIEDRSGRQPAHVRRLRGGIPQPTMPTPEVVRQLLKDLGHQLLAITVGAPPAVLDKWATGEVLPAVTQERRLRQAREAWQVIRSVESIETTRAWWMGMKEQLGDLSPAEAIADDRADAVMSIARDFVEGG